MEEGVTSTRQATQSQSQLGFKALLRVTCKKEWAEGLNVGPLSASGEGGDSIPF